MVFCSERGLTEEKVLTERHSYSPVYDESEGFARAQKNYLICQAGPLTGPRLFCAVRH